MATSIQTPEQMLERWYGVSCSCDPDVGHLCECCHDTQVIRELIKDRDTRVVVQLEYEDQLPKFDGSLFSAMYDASIVSGVRQYPFVVINEERFYLVKVPE
jgi:hypothetical protein